MFSDEFYKERSPLQDDEVCAQLRDAILANDPARFRQILVNYSPFVADQDRSYGVITLESDDPIQVKTIMVDRMGLPITSDEPMKVAEMLNAEIIDDYMVARIGDRMIRAYVGPMRDKNDKPNKDQD